MGNGIISKNFLLLFVIILLNMNQIAQNIKKIKDNINYIKKDINLIAVSKYFEEDKIYQAIDAGQDIFGENKIQEAKKKWPTIKKKNPNVKLHLIGHLQSNKVKDAVAIFDVIEVLDSIKLARILEKEIIKQNRELEIFIQINIGKEQQKSGIDPNNLDKFLEELKEFPRLNITGLMCIAPKNEDPEKYFKDTANLAKKNNLKNISMGMSADYKIAIKNGANFVRIGSGIFGLRDA
jgi:pyridoxal phosphate enzyme (YggS family)